MIEIPGPYRWLGLIGRGGMGAVYEARDERLKRRVAIKRIPFEIDQNPVRRQRLRREAAALAQLNHPAIVQVYDLIQAEEGDWIVMELVEGPTLADCLSTGPLALPRLLAVGRQVAEGLAQAHARGILHRDLKTENVKLQRQPATVLPSEPWDTSERVKILDFGLAKILADDEGAASSPAPPPRRRPSEIDDDELIELLRAHRFNLRATAAGLGISRTTLYTRLEQCPRLRKAADLDRADLEVSSLALKRRLRELGLA